MDPPPALEEGLQHATSAASLPSTMWEYESLDLDGGRLSPRTREAAIAALEQAQQTHATALPSKRSERAFEQSLAELKGSRSSQSGSDSTEQLAQQSADPDQALDGMAGAGPRPLVKVRSGQHSGRLHRLSSGETTEDMGMASLSVWGPNMATVRAAMASAVATAHASESDSTDAKDSTAAHQQVPSTTPNKESDAPTREEGCSSASSVASPPPRPAIFRLATLRDADNDLSFKVALRGQPAANSTLSRPQATDSRDGSGAGHPGFSFAETMRSIPSTATLWSVGSAAPGSDRVSGSGGPGACRPSDTGGVHPYPSLELPFSPEHRPVPAPGHTDTGGVKAFDRSNTEPNLATAKSFTAGSPPAMGSVVQHTRARSECGSGAWSDTEANTPKGSPPSYEQVLLARLTAPIPDRPPPSYDEALACTTVITSAHNSPHHKRTPPGQSANRTRNSSPGFLTSLLNALPTGDRSRPSTPTPTPRQLSPSISAKSSASAHRLARGSHAGGSQSGRSSPAPGPASTGLPQRTSMPHPGPSSGAARPQELLRSNTETRLGGMHAPWSPGRTPQPLAPIQPATGATPDAPGMLLAAGWAVDGASCMASLLQQEEAHRRAQQLAGRQQEHGEDLRTTHAPVFSPGKADRAYEAAAALLHCVQQHGATTPGTVPVAAAGDELAMDHSWPAGDSSRRTVMTQGPTVAQQLVAVGQLLAGDPDETAYLRTAEWVGAQQAEAPAGSPADTLLTTLADRAASATQAHAAGEADEAAAHATLAAGMPGLSAADLAKAAGMLPGKRPPMVSLPVSLADSAAQDTLTGSKPSTATSASLHLPSSSASHTSHSVTHPPASHTHQQHTAALVPRTHVEPGHNAPPSPMSTLSSPAMGAPPLPPSHLPCASSTILSPVTSPGRHPASLPQVPPHPHQLPPGAQMAFPPQHHTLAASHSSAPGGPRGPPPGWKPVPPPPLPAFPNLLYVDGRDTLQRPVVIVNSGVLDSAHKDSVLDQMLTVLQPVVQQPYVLVVVNLSGPVASSSSSGTAPDRQPSGPGQVDTLAAAWAVSTYKKLARPYRKNVKHIVLVAPSAMARVMLVLAKPIISRKADAKVKKIASLDDLATATNGEVPLPALGFRFLRDARLLPAPRGRPGQAPEHSAAGQLPPGAQRIQSVPAMRPQTAHGYPHGLPPAAAHAQSMTMARQLAPGAVGPVSPGMVGKPHYGALPGAQTGHVTATFVPGPEGRGAP